MRVMMPPSMRMCVRSERENVQRQEVFYFHMKIEPNRRQSAMQYDGVHIARTPRHIPFTPSDRNECVAFITYHLHI